ncbi:MAG: biopolymer transporter ExbD [Deltaproteobacteria bacterium]|nr:biopolymer transporter ExbD [Deltaproteobacteria bacterium]
MKFRRRLEDDEQIPMASMSDLAFLINVFLMAALLFSVNQGLVLELPKMASGGRLEASEVVISIAPDGTVVVDGKTLPLEQLGPYVAARRSAAPKTPVIVKSDRRVVYGHVMDVMDELLRVGIADVALPTAPEEIRR